MRGEHFSEMCDLKKSLPVNDDMLFSYLMAYILCDQKFAIM